IVEAASKIMVNRLLGNSKHAHAACYRHQCKQVKYDSRSPKISQRTGSSCCEGITSVIEAFVASDPLGEGSMSKDAERDGRKGGTEHDTGRMGRRLRNGDRPERR